LAGIEIQRSTRYPPPFQAGAERKKVTLKTASAPAKALIVVLAFLWMLIAGLSVDADNPAWRWLAEAWLGIERLFRS
jgi:hypothetical protein